jgi:hypothetical protein
LVDGQVRRYFLGLVSFGFVAVWATAGMVPAGLSLLACVLTVGAPRLVGRRTSIRSHRLVHERRQRHPVRTRPLRDEVEPTLPMVPDEPSLILELG